MSGAATARKRIIQPARFTSPVMVCIGCGCDDLRACRHADGKPCSWAAVDEASGAGICSVCAEKSVDQLIADGDFPRG